MMDLAVLVFCLVFLWACWWLILSFERLRG
jgi:hypothetical protein